MAKAKSKSAETTDIAIKALKGFDKNLQCRGFQFEFGKAYEHDGDVIACESGFHAVQGSPFDIWSYYPIIGEDGSLTRYAEVTLGGATATHEGDSKIAAARITVDVEVNLPAFIKRAVSRVIDATKGKIGSSGHYAQIGSSGDSAKIGSSGDSAQIGSSGHYAQIGSSGHYAQIGSSGHYAQIGSSGDSAKIGSSGDSAQIGSSGDSAPIGSSGHSAKIGSSGDSAQIGSSGDSAKIGSSGHSAKIGSSGHYAQIGSSGDSAQIGSSGDYAQIVAEGSNAVIASAGTATVTAADGAHIALAEFDSAGKCIGFATGCIGKNGLLPGVAYVARGGKLIPAA